MSDAAEADMPDDPPAKKSRALLFGLIGAVLLGGAAFAVVFTGMVALPFGGAPKEESATDTAAHDENPADYRPAAETAVAFVPLEAMVISLGPQAKAAHLKVRVTVEVEPGTEGGVQALAPRIIDVLNTFLRAVDEREFENPHAMLRLRAQMLRRVQLVSPEGAVRDLLIQEFVLN